jgi:hypothetical protein
MKAPLLSTLALASGNPAAWIPGLRAEAAMRWLPALYRADHWGDSTLVVLATLSLYLMSRAPLREYHAHCFALFLLWEKNAYGGAYGPVWRLLSGGAPQRHVLQIADQCRIDRCECSLAVGSTANLAPVTTRAVSNSCAKDAARRCQNA